MTERRSGPPAWLRRPYEYLVYYGFLLVFALMCLVWSIVSLPLAVLLPKRMGNRFGRWMVSFGFRTYLAVLELTGLVKCDLTALDSLNGERSVIIAPNHPSLIDVVLIVSRLPNVVCIIKATLWDQFIFGGSARLAGYISNISQARLIVDAARELEAGNHLLIFPEGTRTIDNDLRPFKAGFALISKRSCAPVQSVLIDINHPFLSKERPLLEKPQFPLILRARLAERFMPPNEIRPYISAMERYYRNEVANHKMEPSL
jgi:1-acyl-sn-glycerol-3-phosphate acyltransferase